MCHENWNVKGHFEFCTSALCQMSARYTGEQGTKSNTFVNIHFEFGRQWHVDTQDNWCTIAQQNLQDTFSMLLLRATSRTYAWYIRNAALHHNIVILFIFLNIY